MSVPKRVIKDIKNFQSSNLNESGIYCHFDEADFTRVKVLIIGPKDTPYQNGLYLFNLDFPSSYPFEPPKVKFVTYGKNIRFNPNLYVSGKVCLSILGTWSGPSWTSCCTLSTVLLSIQTLLNEYPIQNEPGWENCKDCRSDKYNAIVEYGNVCVATIDTLLNIPYGFEPFKNIMWKYFVNNKSYFYNYLDKMKPTRQLSAKIYGMDIDTKINSYIEKYEKLVIMSEIEGAVETAIVIEEDVHVAVVAVVAPTTKQRKLPTDMASKYDPGVIKEGLDGNKYIVNKTKAGNLRWNKLKV